MLEYERVRSKTWGDHEHNGANTWFGAVNVMNYFPGGRGPVAKVVSPNTPAWRMTCEVPETLGTSTPAGRSFPVPSVTLLLLGGADLTTSSSSWPVRGRPCSRTVFVSQTLPLLLWT